MLTDEPYCKVLPKMLNSHRDVRHFTVKMNMLYLIKKIVAKDYKQYY